MYMIVNCGFVAVGEGHGSCVVRRLPDIIYWMRSVILSCTNTLEHYAALLDEHDRLQPDDHVLVNHQYTE